jgi:hypothetical protein
MTELFNDPFLRILAAQLADSGYEVSIHTPDGEWPIEWLESSLPNSFDGKPIKLRLLSLDDQSDDADEDDDDEPIPSLALIRMDALLPFALDKDQLPLAIAAIETINDILPFGAIGMRPHAQCWAWHYTAADPAARFNGLMVLQVIQTLRFYMEALSPVLVDAFGQQTPPDLIQDALRLALSRIAANAESAP